MCSKRYKFPKKGDLFKSACGHAICRKCLEGQEKCMTCMKEYVKSEINDFLKSQGRKSQLSPSEKPMEIEIDSKKTCRKCFMGNLVKNKIIGFSECDKCFKKVCGMCDLDIYDLAATKKLFQRITCNCYCCFCF